MVLKKLSLPLLVVLLVVSLAASAFLYMRVSALKADPQAAAREEAEELVEKVSELILLPQGELPTVATVSDPSKLEGQAFFLKAKVGDKVLLYSAARKAYLYDPEAHKVLEVAPINLGAENEIVPEVDPAGTSEETTPEEESAAEEPAP
jgi:hypothetical protein